MVFLRGGVVLVHVTIRWVRVQGPVVRWKQNTHVF